MLLVLFFQFLRETSKKHFCCLNFLLSKLVWTQKCFCFFPNVLYPIVGSLSAAGDEALYKNSIKYKV